MHLREMLTMRRSTSGLVLLPLVLFGIVLFADERAGGQEESSLPEAVRPIGPIEKIAGGFAFVEGPAVADDGTLFFTDIPNQRIHRWTERDGVSVLQDPSGHANGLLWTADRGLLACRMDGEVVAIDPSDGRTTVLASTFDGKRFNAPNDLTRDADGGIYFTDPLYMAPEPLPQGRMSVYYLAPSGDVTRVVEDLPAPNGIVLSPDGRTLYVIPSRDPQVRAYEVEGPGKLGAERIHCRLTLSDKASPESGGDGGAVDEQGNLYVTTELGVQIVAPDGKLLGTIAFPEYPANVTFGGEEFRTLIVTARTGVYRVRTNARGYRAPTGR